MKLIKVNNQKIWLSHFPLKTWVGKDKGAWNIYGHCHGRLEDPELNGVDVGVQSWKWYPVSFKTLQKYFSGLR